MATSEQGQELQPITDRMKFEHGELLCKVEVDCRPAYHALPCGYVAGHGKNIAIVRRRDLPQLMAQIEPEPQEIVAAQRRYDRELDEYLRKNCEGVEPSEIPKRRAVLAAEFAMSMEMIFQRDMGRSIKPFVSVKVLEENISVPEDEASVEQQNAIAVGVAKAVAQALANMQAPQQKKS
jgi:hypothetical protein